MAALLLGSVPAAAQFSYDAAQVSGKELNGTARFVGMGGAMSALGGDLSVMRSNPAGIGIYRSHDLALSFGFNNTRNSATFNEVNMAQNRNRASFDQVGFVYSNHIGNKTALRFVNFGFNYHKSKNFNKLFNMGGNLGGTSQTFQMAEMTNAISDFSSSGFGANDYTALIGHDNPYTDRTWDDVSTLTKMGVRTGLVEWSNADNKAISWLGKSNEYNSREEGGISEYDFTAAFNVSDRFYFGVDLGVYDLNYTKSSLYLEDLLTDDMASDNGGYQMKNYFRAEGTGIDLKLGAIIRPFEYSPFRIGLAVHTPTWYNVTYSYSSRIESSIPLVDNGANLYQDTYDALGRNFVYDYQIRTPWVFNASLGTTFSGVVAVGAEYEYQNYSTCRFADVNGVEFLDSTHEIENNLQGVHMVRLGIESSPVAGLSVRAGYNYSTAAFKDEAYKYMAYYETRTDTEYNNTKALNTVTVGLGYRWKMLYADFAYKYDIYKSDFRPFDDVQLPVTKVDNERHQVLFTLGARF